MNRPLAIGLQRLGARRNLAKRNLAKRGFLARVALFSIAALLLAACASSPPAKFYNLTTAPSSGTAPSSADAAPPVRVATVRIPPMLDRQEIARPSAGNQLEINGQERWDAPLDEMIQQTLTRDLIARLPSDKVILPAAPAPANAESIAVNILQFQSDVTGNVVFEGSWSLVPPHATSPALIRDFHYTAAASSQSTADEVSTMSTLLGQLADDIARSRLVH
jgi:uncharacterized protein